MKKIVSDKAFRIELIAFLFLQIFIDMYRVFFESSVQIFGISLPELVNFLFFGFLTLVFFIKFFKTPKVFLIPGIYAVFLLVYLVFHSVNILKFNQNIFYGSELNLFKEIYFIGRTYVIPAFVFYFFICAKFSFDAFEKVLSALSLLISSNIILTNFFKVSFISYASSLEKNSFIIF